jgi:Lrp/AsnC family transcriptional regulator for asnA, asnC and gidA
VTSHKIDTIDVKILRTLLIDARTSFAKIARECGVSTNTIFNRFQKLKKTGVITGTRLMMKVDEKIFFISIGIDTYPEFEDEVLELITSIPNIILAYPQVGKYDIYGFAVTKSLKELDQLRGKLKSNRGIKNIVTMMWVSDVNFYLDNLKIIPNEDSKNG